MENNKLKTGTTTVGIKFKDGIILAADRRATAGNYIVDKSCEKVFNITEDMALTMAGAVSDAQLLVKLIKAELQLRFLKTNRKPTVKEAANLLSSMIYQNARSYFSGGTHFLLGGKDNSGYHLYDLFVDGSIIEIKDFVSSGSGSVIAWGVLETSYEDDMEIGEAKKLAMKSINAALQRDSASGGGLTLFTITKEGAKKEIDKLASVNVSE